MLTEIRFRKFLWGHFKVLQTDLFCTDLSFAIIIRKLEAGRELLLTRPGNYTAHLGPHREVHSGESKTGGETEDRKRSSGVYGPGVLLLLGLRAGV